MNYEETIHWMFNQLPMYQRQGKAAYKANLDNTIAFANYLGNPESRFRSIHVAGTNGKGSTSHMIASILQEAGYKVGLYTSPHLKDYRERIKINGKVISKQFVIGFIKKHKSFFEKHHLSFFEMTVGLAFDFFAEKKVDVAVIEVGLGGRLDSTNIITPEVSVITNIGLDHTQFLGNTLEKIAKEKAGIIKPNIPVVIGETQKATKPVFIEMAKKHNSEIVFADKSVKTNFSTDLLGRYQSKNVKTAVQAIKTIKSRFKVNNSHIVDGLQKVVTNTELLGRWQILQSNPKVICDTAHNKEGLNFTIKQLLSEEYKKLHFVIGFVNDKEIDEVINLFPKNAYYYFCKPNILRGMDVLRLQEDFAKNNIHGNVFQSVKDAYDFALKKASKHDVIYVGGSTFVVAEII